MMVAINPRRRRNPRRHRRSNPRRHYRRNPGFFSGVLAPVKQHGLGFGVGALLNNFVVAPALGNFLGGQPLIQSAAKIVVGPLLAGLGKKVPLLKKLGNKWDSVGLFFVAIGVNEVVGQLVGGMGTAKGFGYLHPFRRRAISSIGPTARMGSIGPTAHMASIGPTAMHGLGDGNIYQTQVPSPAHSEYHQEYSG
jgi:hypothetical protein